MYQALELTFIDPAGARRLLQAAQEELDRSRPDPNADTGIVLFTAPLSIWERDYRTALAASAGSLGQPRLDPLVGMNLHGAHLLAALLCEDHDAMNHHLTDPDIEAMRQQWLEGRAEASTGCSATRQSGAQRSRGQASSNRRDGTSRTPRR